jgi:chemotaxis protein methyltransferase CheR
LNTEYRIKINQNYLNLFRELIYNRLGIYISIEKDYLLDNKLEKLIKNGGYRSISQLFHSLKLENKQSVEDLIHYITTTHTFFFREKIHLKILYNDILLKKKKKTRIWCAASSTGEEVYSIIIELLEHGIRDFLIIATDINSNVLKICKRGIYYKDRLKEVPPNIIKKYFTKSIEHGPNYYKVNDSLKEYFILKKINLIEKTEFKEKLDYIFCRNVLIYFNKDTQTKVVENILRNLKDTGYLFIGHSESLLHLSDKIESVFSSVYNKKL